jgi:8-oxo-dGTP diphosphatase
MREEKRCEVEVHVAGISYRKGGRGIEVLAAKRTSTRELYPGKWECGGGQVGLNENFEEAVTRQLREELGVEIKVIAPISVYEILTPHLPQKKIPGIQFACLLKGGTPKIDGKEHEEWKWFPLSEIGHIDFIPGVREAILKGARIIQKEF